MRARAGLDDWPVITDGPQIGWYTTRLVKGGPIVPVRMWIDQHIDMDTGELTEDERIRCTVNGREADPERIWLWCCQHPISGQHYDNLASRIESAGPYSPDARPHEPVDWLTVPLGDHTTTGDES